MKRMFLVLLLAATPVPAPATAQTASPEQANTVETGAINGAPFYIEIPKQWNKGLVLYAHGYTVAGGQPPAMESPGMRGIIDVFVSRGFAFAASSYSRQGWAVKEALEDTEALRRYVVSKYGAVSETYITGHSMGGHITMATIERYPDAYQGAMPMCGPLGAAVDFLNTGLFDMLVTFEAVFPGTIGSPYRAGGRRSQQGQGGDCCRPGARRPLRAAFRADTGASRRCLAVLSNYRCRIEAARRGRALRQPESHLLRLRRRCGDQSDSEALHGSASRSRVRPAVRHTDGAHRRSDADHPHDVRRAGAWK